MKDLHIKLLIASLLASGTSIQCASRDRDSDDDAIPTTVALVTAISLLTVGQTHATLDDKPLQPIVEKRSGVELIAIKQQPAKKMTPMPSKKNKTILSRQLRQPKSGSSHRSPKAHHAHKAKIQP